MDVWVALYRDWDTATVVGVSTNPTYLVEKIKKDNATEGARWELSGNSHGWFLSKIKPNASVSESWELTKHEIQEKSGCVV